MIYIGDIDPIINLGNESNIEIYNEEELLYPSVHEELILTDSGGTSVYPSASTTIYDVTMNKVVNNYTSGNKQTWILPFDYRIEANTGIQFYGVRSIDYDSTLNLTTVYTEELPVGYRIPANTPIMIKCMSGGTYSIHARGVTIKAPVELEHYSTPNCYDGTALYCENETDDVYAAIMGHYTRGSVPNYCLAVNNSGNLINVYSSQNLTPYRWVVRLSEMGTEPMTAPNADNYCIDEIIDDYATRYFTIKSLETGNTISFTNDLEYSQNDGYSWSALTSGSTITIGKGQKRIFRAQLTPDSTNGIGTFSSTGQYEVEGNAMSMLYGDNFVGQTDLTGKNYAFKSLFSGNTINSAEHLILPATTLSIQCYNQMFSDCSSLLKAPNLPATTLSVYCYTSMFSGCSSLSKSPNLPATTITSGCYQKMFQGCANLTTAPELPASTLTNGCYYQMFSGCTSLIMAPELPATTLDNSCYYEMFKGCSSLVTPPELPATTLAISCYRGMFNGCTSLSAATELSATTLVDSCYFSMFQGCTSLATAPELPALTLDSHCYQYMFSGCTNLNYIKMLATDISATDCLLSWVANVSQTGTFVKNISQTSLPTGGNGIPSGWTVQDNAIIVKSPDYIERTSQFNGYIPLGEYFTPDTKIVLKHQQTTAGGGVIIGDNFIADNNDWRIFFASSTLYYDFLSDRNSKSTSYSNLYEWEIGNYYIKDLTTGTYLINKTPKTGFVRPNQMYLYHMDDTDVPITDYGKIISVEIYQNDVLVKDFIPWTDMLGNYGLFDKISKTTFSSVGNMTGSSNVTDVVIPL